MYSSCFYQHPSLVPIYEVSSDILSIRIKQNHHHFGVYDKWDVYMAIEPLNETILVIIKRVDYVFNFFNL
jgi:hypothetical protein